jgi:hypothetical protein
MKLHIEAASKRVPQEASRHQVNAPEEISKVASEKVAEANGKKATENASEATSEPILKRGTEIFRKDRS